MLSSAGTTQNVVQGNAIGVAGDGLHALANNDNGVILNAGVVGNQLIGNTVSGNTHAGVLLAGASQNQLLANLIGTAADGSTALPNRGDAGVVLDNATINTIGGTTAFAANRIAGNLGDGIQVRNGSSGNTIAGNFIGTNAPLASRLGNVQNGVRVTGQSSNNTIGGTARGAGNTIADNGRDGVEIVSGTGDAILGNAIFANTRMGIELGPGANNNQTFPVLTAAYSTGSSSLIQGMLTSTPNTTFRIEFFDNDQADPSGFGQGQIFLPSATLMLTTGPSGTASFSQPVPVVLCGRQFVTATATDPNQNTSEFSATAPVTALSLTITGMALIEPPSGTTDLDFTVNLSAPSPQTTTVDYVTSTAPPRFSPATICLYRAH